MFGDYKTFDPQPVVETVRLKGTIPPKFEFNAEVMFYDGNYVIQTGILDREEAQRIADEKCAELKEAMLEAGRKVLDGLTLAKA